VVSRYFGISGSLDWVVHSLVKYVIGFFYFSIGTMAPRKKRKFYTSGNDLEAKRAKEKKFIKKYIGLDLDDTPDIVEAVKGQGRNSIRLSKYKKIKLKKYTINFNIIELNILTVEFL
jgi:hypothetical protein